MLTRSLATLLIVASSMALAAPGAALFGCDVLPCHEERTDLGEVFRAFGVEGTFVLTKAGSERGVVYNSERAQRAYVPASTFKIVNSLIALETGVMKDEDEVIPYGGRPQPFKHWERDMGMREAIALSAVPIFQEIARRMGLDRMREWVDWLQYGNGQIGTVVDRFWLDGPLEITAFQQAVFMARLGCEGTSLVRLAPRPSLPSPSVAQMGSGFFSAHVSERSRTILKRMILLEERDGARLYGKTGWLFDTTPQIGWWVGWIERDGRVQGFALNIDIKTPDDAKKRVELGRALLAKLGAW